jgi:hypothetical protein
MLRALAIITLMALAIFGGLQACMRDRAAILAQCRVEALTAYPQDVTMQEWSGRAEVVATCMRGKRFDLSASWDARCPNEAAHESEYCYRPLLLIERLANLPAKEAGSTSPQAVPDDAGR